MSEESASRPPDPDDPSAGAPSGPPASESAEWRLGPPRPGWPDYWDDEGFLVMASEEADPGDREYEDPDNAPPSGLDNAQLAALIEEARQFSAAQAEAAARRARSGHPGAIEAIGSVLSGRRG